MRETIPAALDGERVDRVVALLTGVSRAEAAAMVTSGAVRLGGAPVASRSRRVTEGEELDLAERPVAARPGLEPDAGVVFDVVHADDDLVIVDKPPGLVVHPGAGNRRGTLVHGLLARFPDLATAGAGDPDRPGIVHRLDKGTSGLLVVARTAAAYHALVGLLRERAVDRRYLTLTWGHVEAPAGVVDAPVGRAPSDRTRMAVSAGGREARTRYQVLARFHEPCPLSLLECRLETGRTHQVRVHLAAIGHPVVGDARYGGARPVLAAPRPFLHAHRLAFAHPVGGSRVSFSSPLPPDLEEVRARIR